MKFCSKCGKQMDDGDVFCPDCGAQSETCYQQTNQQYQQPYISKRSVDKPSIGWAILGFFFPLTGLILYLVIKDMTPRRAESLKTGALIGFIVGVVISIICVTLIRVFIEEIFGSIANSYYY